MRISRYEPFLEVYEMELMDYFDIRKLRMKGSSFCKERKVMNELRMFYFKSIMETLVSCVRCLPCQSAVFTDKRNQNEIIYSQ